ncbi:CDP-4-dehydro-6-deoxyglucose reductase [Noviherbaspirillum humi]|uniref:CDP-4-dehydro-6-deoxyglucose reductase n=1 Tax=Noviherbaspirillum humi TaxID=1688639 RepID=A0A239F2C3_9BURK|nr:CDP-6-deoxy-delta-3,4-glucoseen reductase [Noviherbaspirillum humi]SNS50312.1 CDP-4-dehydro-6-deoxyglucose reductase [Noviherbaspirillum humi]
MTATNFEITLAPSGHRFPCAPGESILKAGLAAGFFLPYSCRSGMCNTCRATVVSGRVDIGDVHPKYLSEADRELGKALICRASPLSDCEIEVAEIDPADAMPLHRMPSRVLKLERVAPDVMLVVLGLPANEPVMFRAGQYLDVLLKDGSRRSYSIANLPSSEGVRQVELHIRLLPGGRFGTMLESMKARELLQLEIPLGSFYWREQSDKPMIMLASGTGFAPIKSIIEYAIARGNRRPITLYWGGRTRADLYMMDMAQGWAAQHDNIRFVPVLSDATPACAWEGRRGFVHRAVMDDFPDMSGHQVYACGAPIVISSARRDFSASCGLPEEEFFADSFLTEADKQSA